MIAPETVWQNITNNIRELMKSDGRPQKVIAAEMGVSPTTLSEYVHGRAFPAYDTLVKLCYALGCDFEDIIGRL